MGRKKGKRIIKIYALKFLGIGNESGNMRLDLLNGPPH